MEDNADVPLHGDGQDDELIHLEDLTFDFEDYFERSKAKQLSPQEEGEFDARIMGMYCRDIYMEVMPPTWILTAIADEFMKVLAGNEWNESFPLPWNPRKPFRSNTEQQALDIFCEIANFMRREPDLKITQAIEKVADMRHVSFETARAAWYKNKKVVEAQMEHYFNGKTI